jgi:hypothetical protein
MDGLLLRRHAGAPFVNVKTILYRNDPILTCAPQHKPVDETGLLKGIAGAAQIWRSLEACGVPEVLGCGITKPGPQPASLRSRYASAIQATRARRSTIASSCQGGAYAGKWTVVVDEDIDAGDLDQVLWAMCTRFDPLTDIDLIQKAWASKRDPLFLPGNFNNRILIDACIPYDRSSRERSQSPSTSAPICASACDRNFRNCLPNIEREQLVRSMAGRSSAFTVGPSRLRTRAMRSHGRAPSPLVAAQPASSAGVEDFYKGKTVSLLIGYSVGGGYDTYGRLVARHLGKHIPGNPTIVPAEHERAGSLKAANYLYSVAPKDGSVIGTFSRSQGIAPLIDKAEFDSTKFTWLGSVTDEVSLCVTRHDAPVKTFSELLITPATIRGRGRGLRSPTFSRCSTATCSAPRSRS